GAGATPGLAMLGAEAPAPDLPVLIKADARTPHQAVMTAMDAVSQLGLARIAFAATQPEPGDAP
ncbi:MAG TPA: biopolymer transporter ExbD, partial [Chromatiaceae bacterium]|nr:biopolymer transporter ExbD [Chromatiaceae bacterium]